MDVELSTNRTVTKSNNVRPLKMFIHNHCAVPNLSTIDWHSGGRSRLSFGLAYILMITQSD